MSYSSDEDSNFSDVDTTPEVNKLSDSEESASNSEEKPKDDYLNMLEEHSILMKSLTELNENFLEEEKTFEKQKKEYFSERKRLSKEIDSHFKKMSKTIVTKVSKASKTKRKGNKNGGFNKPQPVPKVLKKFLEIDEDELPRPKVASLLHSKFKELGFKDGKVTKITDKKVAKQLGVKKDHEITFSSFQKFLAKFYNDEKESLNA